MTIESAPPRLDELLDEESIAVLAILLAVALEFGFGFAKTVAWWAGLVAGPAALIALIVLFRVPRSHASLVRAAAWVVRNQDVTGPRRRQAASAGDRGPSNR